MSIGYFQWTKIGCFRWTRSGCFRRTLTAENGRRSWNRQMRIWYINDKKAVEISPQPFLYLALIFIAVNLSARYSIC